MRRTRLVMMMMMMMMNGTTNALLRPLPLAVATNQQQQGLSFQSHGLSWTAPGSAHTAGLAREEGGRTGGGQHASNLTIGAADDDNNGPTKLGEMEAGEDKAVLLHPAG